MDIQTLLKILDEKLDNLTLEMSDKTLSSDLHNWLSGYYHGILFVKSILVSWIGKDKKQ